MRKDAPNRAERHRDPLRIARELLGFEAFRDGQEGSIRAVLKGQDVLAVLPTGAGKSAIYQIAGTAIPGATVIVSPLIALQRDQADKLEAPETGGAAIVNSTITAGDQREAFDELEQDALEFIFLAPEQLHREEVLARLREARPSLFVVDEAHCISEWGHDFRPDYMRLGAVIDELGHPRVLALTATAPERVRDEIIERLHMRSPRVVLGDMDRPNIWLGVRWSRNGAAKLRELVAEVQSAEKPGIVYVATRRHAEEIADALCDAGVDAAFYHAGMNKSERNATQAEFMSGGIDVMAATSAFGMGVDKADLRFVFHYDVPASLEAYYQEVGRAGRDGEPARALLFYRPQDLALHKFFAAGGRLDADEIEAVAEAVQQAGEVDKKSLREMTDLSASKLAKATTELEDQGIVSQSATGVISATKSEADLQGAAEIMLEHQDRRRADLLGSLQRMQMYAELRDCRRRYLLDYFGQDIDACGRCDNCEQGLPATTDDAHEQPFPVKTRVVHSKLGKGTVLDYSGSHVTILFDEAGEKSLDVSFALEHDLMSRA